jgi:hypothetical protein
LVESLVGAQDVDVEVASLDVQMFQAASFSLSPFPQGLLSVVNVSVIAFDDHLGIRDVAVLLVSFDKEFDDSIFSNCPPGLVLNVGLNRVGSWYPRSYFRDQYGLDEAQMAFSLSFLYVVSYNDTAPNLDFGSQTVLKGSALSFTCSVRNILDLSALSVLSVTPRYVVSSKPAKPVFLRAVKGGSFGLGDRIDIIVDFDTPVEIVDSGNVGNTSVGGTSLALNNGARASLIGYAPGSSVSKRALLFSTIVARGDDVAFLDVNWTAGFRIGSRSLFAIPSDVSLDDSAAYAGMQQPRVSLRNSANISIVTGAVRFPPANYDARDIPFPTGLARWAVPFSSPVVVRALLDFASIFDVNDKSQSFRADVTLQQVWLDNRFVNVGLPFVTHVMTREYNLIWHPKLSFHNAREFLRPMDFTCRVFNNGTVVLQQRYIHTFSARMNARKFPFDSQNFTILVRSARYDRRSVMVEPVSPSQFHVGRSSGSGSRRQVLHSDGTWEFTSIQALSTQSRRNRLHSNASFLQVVVHGSRISSFSIVVLVLPSVAICLAQIVAYFFPLKSDWRMSVCITGLFAIITFNFVLVQLSPPVSYMTTMTMLSLCTTFICLFNLIVQTFIRSIFSAVELIRKEGKDKKDGKEEDTLKTNGDYIELGSTQDSFAKKNAPLHNLNVCCCIKVTQDNRMMWLRRVIFWNEIAKAIFAGIVVVVILAVILPSVVRR